MSDTPNSNMPAPDWAIVNFDPIEVDADLSALQAINQVLKEMTENTKRDMNAKKIAVVAASAVLLGVMGIIEFCVLNGLISPVSASVGATLLLLIGVAVLFHLMSAYHLAEKVHAALIKYGQHISIDDSCIKDFAEGKKIRIPLGDQIVETGITDMPDSTEV